MVSLEIQIGSKMVGDNHPTFIVAEVSGNHDQSFEKAADIIKAAAEAGADAIKLQTYTPDTMTIDSDKEWFKVGQGTEDIPQVWKNKNLYQLYQKAYTPWEWQPKLKELAESLGLILFSTPFDATAVDFLAKMGVLCFKIASYEATDIPLLKKVAGMGKPVIMSVGFASLEEVERAISTLRDSGLKDIIVLHCVTGYSDDPKIEEMNLRTIVDIRERFDVISGFSDNNVGIKTPIIASTMGAAVLEKHITLRRADEGMDARFSLEPAEFRKMGEAIREMEQAKGCILMALSSCNIQGDFIICLP